MAMEMTRSSQGLAPWMRFSREWGGDVLFGLTGKSRIQTEGSGVKTLRFARGTGAGAGGRRSPPV
jgi:hypothetical protein